MQFNITSSLGVCLSEKGFSLDELIYRLDDLFKNKAFPEIMAGILMIFDEWLKVLVMKKARLPFSCGCGGDEVGHSAQGDVKVLLGIRQSGSVFPIGTWTGHETWEEIGRQLERRKVKFPDGSILVRDGELGLAEGLASIATSQQRCQWHVVRDTYHAMWQDGGKKPDIGPVQDRLKRIMAIELPEESFEAVPDEKKDALRFAPMYSFVAIFDMFPVPPFYAWCPVFGKRGRPKPYLPLLRVSVIMANCNRRKAGGGVAFFDGIWYITRPLAQRREEHGRKP